uniref:Electron transfer flavoprotein-ubiquinone oxidoreductase n=1 Tax=Blastobotrys adeninivorans TaxID=409370 RepID=A0A060SWP5_BLAAD
MIRIQPASRGARDARVLARGIRRLTCYGSRARPASAVLSGNLSPLARARSVKPSLPFRVNSVRLYSTEPAETELPPREADEVDVCIVGGGPAGLAAAIRLKQLDNEKGSGELRVIVLEKAPDMGAHTLSGAVLEPRALDELLPNWRDDPPSPLTPVTSEGMKFLTSKSAIPIPEPPQMKNHGNYIVSLNQVVKWLAEKAEELGVEVYPGFSVSEVIYDDNGAVKGIATNDMGVARDFSLKDNFERGMEFHAKATLFAEGCHGSLTKQLIKKYNLRENSDPQTYGIGLKEVWEVPKEQWKEGYAGHTMGYPLSKDVYGGGFQYHFGDGLVTVGLVVGLDYENPWINPYMEFQKMKHHPFYANVLKGGTCISYGARALNEGGFQSIPKLNFPGGGLIGCTAGFLNVPKIKGTHTAMKSGMVAAEAAFEEITAEEFTGPATMEKYATSIKDSWVWKELYEVRNVRPSFHNPLKMYGGIAYSGLDTLIFKGRTPWTFHHKQTDAAATKPADQFQKIEYPKPDGKISFDLLTSVSRTGTNHDEDEPCHLRVADWDAHTEASYPKFKGVENRFCPAGVYEYVEDASKPHGVRFQINSQNCIHCKTCDIKVPTQDINWTVPEGGDGPKYQMT